MQIVIRCCGERTEKKCIQLAKKQGNVHIIREVPFGKAIRETYKFGMNLLQKWLPVIDADVLLYPYVLTEAIKELNKHNNKKIFCFDGKTDDKILMHARRAGIHIYRTAYLDRAVHMIDNNHIKPESNVRRKMERLGFPTFTNKMVFGKHDYEQYYHDLWRKAVCQTKKLKNKIRNKPRIWLEKSKYDKDFLVIYYGHIFGLKHNPQIIIDKNCDFNAVEEIRKLGLKEKGKL